MYLTDCCTGTYRWQDHCLVFGSPFCRPRCIEKQRRPQNPGYFQGKFCVAFLLIFHPDERIQESGLLQAASPFYKTFAIECSRTQVSVDMFLFSAAYQDVATLGNHISLKFVLGPGWPHLSLACLPHYTSGQTYYYPAFNAGRSEDAVKFAHEFGEVLATPIMLEAVMRVRASRGKILNIVPYL